MCMVSNIGDVFGTKWRPYVFPSEAQIYPPTNPLGVSREEFDSLRKEVEALKELLRAAKKFDEKTGQPDCEMGDKVAIIRKIAEAVGVDLDDIFDIKAK